MGSGLDEEHVPELVVKGHALLARHARKILVFWVLSMFVGGFFAPYFVNKAEDRLTAPFHSRAAKEEREFFKLYPEISQEDMLLLYTESSSKTIVCPATACKKTCTGVDERVANLYKSVSTAVTNAFPEVQYLSFFNVSGTKLDMVKCQFASEDGRATFGLFTYNPVTMPKANIHRMIDIAQSTVKTFLHDCEGDQCNDLTSGVTGVDVLAKESSDSTEQQLVKVDTFTMPVALFIFFVMVRSWRLLLLCIWNMMVTVATSFGVLSFCVKVLKLRPMSVQATFAQALAVSMSIDYSLFLLRRFRDEIKNGRNVTDASRIMLAQAGHVVALSCCTFMLVFVGFLFLPSHDFMALGEVAVVTLAFALMVNITNTVAALYIFPDFFTRFSFNSGANAVASASVVDAESNQVPLLRPTPTGKPRFKRGAPYKGLYFQYMKLFTRFPYNIIFIIVVYSCFIPLALQATRLEHNQNAVQISPQGAEGAKIFAALQKHFPPGLLGQFSLTITSDTVKATSKEFFDFTHSVLLQVSKDTKVPLSAFLSPAYLQGKSISYLESSELRNQKSLTCKVGSVTGELCALYQYVWGRSINVANSALITTIQVPFNPYSGQGIDFVIDVRKTVDSILEKNPKFRILFTGNECDFYEDMAVAFGSLPALTISTLIVVFIIISVGFRSAFVPLRLMLTVFVPLATVFGLAVLIYQDGLLKSWKIQALMPTEDGFFFFIPIVCAFQALGLVLDYDIFLVHRVQEHRASGYDIQAAIIKSIWEVQTTIVAAGLIMAIVFAGVLLSDEIAVDQFGFLMCASVLADTFIVQCVLFGPILSLGDKFSWWPRQMPQENLITLDDEEFTS